MGPHPSPNAPVADAECRSLSDDQRRVARERIHRAAWEALAERGLATTAEEVAARAGVSVRTVFRHFGTRDRLLADALRARVRSTPERLPRPERAPTLEAWLRTLLREVHANTDLARVYWDSAAEPALTPELAEAVGDARRARGKLVRWATTSAWRLARGRGQPPSWLGDAFAMHLSGFATRAVAADSGRSPEAVTDASARVLAAAVEAAADVATRR